jgi:Sec-independent protein translocase protein TatA
MFGIGFSELVVIGIILVIAVGPNRMPGLLKAVVRGYNEFRKATRELRASTGIDEILQDEDLKSLRKPLYVPPAPAPKKPAAPSQRTLTDKERAQENPAEGVDIAEILAAEKKPSPEEEARREAVRQQKIAAAKELEGDGGKRVLAEKEAEAERIRQAKMSAAHGAPSEEEAERIRQAKIAANEPGDAVDDDEAQRIIAEKEAAMDRIRQEKIAAAAQDDDDESRRAREEKMAAAREAKLAAARKAEQPGDRED